ncbi:hypothetical protein [Microbacterium sp. 77mftsu3.1]|uniref:hypothetical protein n=1 Tax=Microbacterium sp. 77mftsu3.1 TaxID=1761802 RepID=UPI00038047D0|nr:hypothetical protein [Microbacterium sp. 77mftsu3.1]SDH32883.1 hypothetical protein SAMN04488590_3040 [Microbacterium sp. 77mftsu3.1]
MGGIAAGVVVAAASVFAVPMWIDNVNDAQAIGDLTKIREAQSVLFDVKGGYSDNMADLNSDVWGVHVQLSGGVSLVSMEIGSSNWCATVKSATGKYFGASAKIQSTEAFDTAAEASDATCNPPAIAGPTTLEVTEVGDELRIISSDAVCEMGFGEYRFRERYSTTTSIATWGAYGAWTSGAAVIKSDHVPGARYGFQVEARCAVGTKKSKTVTSDEAEFLTSIAAPTTPTTTVTADSTTVSINAAATVCDPGTTASYRMRYRFATSGSGSYLTGSFGSGRAWTVTPITRGARYGAVVDIRCSNALTVSPIITTPEATTVTAIPVTTIPDVTIAMNGSDAVATASAITCQPGETRQYRFQWRSTFKSTVPGTWSAFTSWGTASQDTLTGVTEGTRVSSIAEARCSTAHTSSPGAASAEAVVISPISDPSVPDLTMSQTGTTVRATVAKVCASPTTQQYSFRARDTSGGSTSAWSAWDDWSATAYREVTSAAAGVRYGFYARIKCVTPFAESTTATTAADSALVPIATPTAPTAAIRPSGDNIIITSTAITCEPGTTAQYRFRYRYTTTSSAGAWGAWESWGTTRTATIPATRGALYGGNVYAQCATFATTSDIASSDEVTTDTPIAAPGALTANVTMSGTSLRTAATGATCEPGETLQHRFHYRSSTKTSDLGTWGSYGSWVPTSAMLVSSVAEGHRWGGQVQARCTTYRVDGAVTTSDEDSTISPIAAPDAPNLVVGMSSGNVRATAGIACASPLSNEWSFRSRKTKTDVDGTWSGWDAWDSVRTRDFTEPNPGVKYEYQAQTRCSTPYATSPVTATATDYVIAPIAAPAAAPSVVLSISGGDITGTSTVVTCETGTRAEYRIRARSQLTATVGGYGAWDAFNTTRSRAYAAGQGREFNMQAEARCATDIAASSGLVSDEAAKVVPIDAPAAPAVSSTVSSPNVRGTSSVVACPSGTTAEYQTRLRGTFNATIDASTFTAWDTASATRTRDHGGEQGKLYEFQSQARCTSYYTDSPWTLSALTAAAKVVFPIATPAAPTITQPSATAETTTWSIADKCPANTDPRFERRWHMDDGAGWRAWNGLYASGDWTQYTASEGYEYSGQARYLCKTVHDTSELSAISSTIKALRNVKAPTAFSWRYLKNSTGFQIDHPTGGNCGPGTVAKDAWSDFSLYTGSTTVPRALRLDGDLWNNGNDSNSTIISNWTNEKNPGLGTSFFKGYPGTWQNPISGSAWTNGSQHKGFTIAKAKMYQVRKCVNPDTDREKIGGHDFSPMYSPNVKIN